MTKSLYDMQPGEHAQVVMLCNQKSMQRRLMDIGLVEQTDVTCVGKSPFGDPAAFLIRGAVVAIRSEDGKRIIVKNIRKVSE